MEHVDKPIVLHFTPALPCTCGRMSHYGEMFNGYDGLLVRCYEHGLVQFTVGGQKPTPYALQELYASIVRFVLASYDDFGIASVIGPINPREVPGYRPLDAATMERYSTRFEGDQDAWIVRYAPDANSLITVYVVWSYDENMFYLYTEKGMRT